MKNIVTKISCFLIIFVFVLGAIPGVAVNAQTQTDTPIPTNTPSATDTPTPTNTPTNLPGSSRPLVVINSYSYGDNAINPGSDFTLNIRFKNNGNSDAYNLVATFESTDFLPLESGGVRSVGYMDSGSSTDISQPLRANATLWGAVSGIVTVNLNYTDNEGEAFTERFTITINLRPPVYSSVATATPTLRPSAQLVVGGYEVDVDPLQPGSIFKLKVSIHNLGTVDAQGVTMVLGGGVLGTDGMGTPTGGLSGGSSDLSTFAPIHSSNLIYLDKVMRGEPREVEVDLIVNVATTPGAYPFKISFSYLDAGGNRVIDDQVITLLIYSLPKIELSFYRDPGVLIAGQMMPLPVQVTNLGKTTTVLGNLRVTSDGADLTDNVMLIGSLEPGGYFTLDPMAMPYNEGPLDINVVVNYTDDFNQPRTVEQVLTVQVEPSPVFEPLPGDGIDTPIVEQSETMVQKVMRFLKGMLGLGSGKPEPSFENIVPSMEGESQEGEIKVAPLPSGKGEAKMRFWDLFNLIIENLNRRKGRVMLTAIGVVIGTAAVVLLVSLAIGLQQSATSNLWGINDLSRIEVYPNYETEMMMVSGGGGSSQVSEANTQKMLTNSAITDIAKINGVKSVIPRDYLMGSGMVKYGSLETWANIMGVGNNNFADLGYIINQGTLEQRKGTIIIGSAIPNNFYDPNSRPGQEMPEPPDLMDQRITLTLMKWTSDGQEVRKKVTLQVVGVLQEMRNEADYNMFVSMEELTAWNEWFIGKRINRNKDGYSNVIVRAESPEMVADITTQINDLGFQAYSPQSTVDGINSFFTILQLVFGGIGAIALLVAAIGIANTMTMAILERTKEIGLMKAIGATNRDVLSIFLGEAAGIGLLGGIGGVLFGWGGSQALNVLAMQFLASQAQQGMISSGLNAVTPPWLLLFAIIFATLVGFLSGLYPALRAATLEPVMALKYE